MSESVEARPFADRLVEALKAFNAKERDHLMRFAYLGDTASYQWPIRYLSDSMDVELRKRLPQDFGGQPYCAFAAMDYHLDWLFAALHSARYPADADTTRLDAFDSQFGIEPSEEGKKEKYKPESLRPFVGTHEDVDLLVAYRSNVDPEQVFIFFVEAKGDSSFSRVQLGRKLVRLNRILEVIGMTGVAEGKFGPARCTLVLAGPSAAKPAADNCFAYLDRESKHDRTGVFGRVQAELRNLKSRHIGHEPLRSHEPLKGSFLELSGFPDDESLLMPERRGKGKKEKFESWVITPRRNTKRGTK